MPLYNVRCFHGAKHDGENRPSIEAETPQAAAEQVCGGQLKEGGKPGELRAVVTAVGAPPGNTFSFFEP